MQKALTLSIVIPAYNEENHLRVCLESIAKQRIMPDEVIVVDNNSSDATVKIAKSYKFVRVIRERKQGIVFARDAGFNASTSDIIGRIDADSILPENWAETVIAFYADNQHWDYGFTGGCYVYNLLLPRFSGGLLGQIVFRAHRLLMGHYILFGSNMALPKDMWEEVKPLTCIRTDIHEDHDLAIHAHRLGKHITYQENFRVGVKLRRVMNQQSKMWAYQMLWPNTLRVHHLKTWPIAWFGGFFLFITTPIVIIPGYLARLIGLRHLNE